MAVYLRSGDVAIMMSSRRLAYHGIPRIIACDQDKVRQRFSLESATSDDEVKGTNEDLENDAAPVGITNSCDTTEYTQQESGKKELCHNCGRNESPMDFNSSTFRSDSDDVNRCIRETMATLTDEVWQPFAQYLETSRINMNVRQVFKPGESFDDCTQ